MRDRLAATDVPSPVLQVLSAAVDGRLLDDVDTMASHLEAAGWVREIHGGAWSLLATPAWTANSGDHDAGVSVFASGSDDLVAHTAAQLWTLLDTDTAGALVQGEPDPHWTTWRTDAVEVALATTPGRTFGTQRVDAYLHLAVARTSTPADGRPHDPARDHRIARTGSPVARWHLAGHDELTDDVVALLAVDEDPAVVAALAAREGSRRAGRQR